MPLKVHNCDQQILESNYVEKHKRQTGPPLVFDASQKGDWDNIRNGYVDGKPSRIKREILETLIVRMDFRRLPEWIVSFLGYHFELSRAA